MERPKSASSHQSSSKVAPSAVSFQTDFNSPMHTLHHQHVTDEIEDDLAIEDIENEKLEEHSNFDEEQEENEDDEDYLQGNEKQRNNFSSPAMRKDWTKKMRPKSPAWNKHKYDVSAENDAKLMRRIEWIEKELLNNKMNEFQKTQVDNWVNPNQEDKVFKLQKENEALQHENQQINASVREQLIAQKEEIERLKKLLLQRTNTNLPLPLASEEYPTNISHSKLENYDTGSELKSALKEVEDELKSVIEHIKTPPRAKKQDSPTTKLYQSLYGKDDTNADIDSLRSQNKIQLMELKNQAKSFQKEVENALDEKLDLKNRMKALESKLSDMQIEKTNLIENMIDQKKQSIYMEEQAKVKTKEAEILAKTLAETEEQLNYYKKHYSSLKKQDSHLKKNVAYVLQKYKDHEQKKYGQLKEQFITLQSKYDLLKSRSQSIEENNNTLLDENNALKTQLNIKEMGPEEFKFNSTTKDIKRLLKSKNYQLQTIFDYALKCYSSAHNLEENIATLRSLESYLAMDYSDDLPLAHSHDEDVLDQHRKALNDMHKNVLDVLWALSEIRLFQKTADASDIITEDEKEEISNTVSHSKYSQNPTIDYTHSSKLDEMNVLVMNLKNDITAKDQRINTLSSQNQSLDRNLKSLEKLLEERAAQYQQQFNDMQAEREQLVNDKNILKQLLEDKNISSDKIQRALSPQRKSYEKLLTDYQDKLLEKGKIFEQKLREIEERYMQNNVDLRQKYDELQVILRENERKIREYKELENQNKMLKNQIDHLEGLLLRKDKMIEDISLQNSGKERDLIDQIKELKSLELTRDRKESELNQLIGILKENITSKEAEITKLLQEKATLNRILDEAETLSTTTTGTEINHPVDAHHVASLNTEIAIREEDLRYKNELIKMLESRIVKMQEENNMITIELQNEKRNNMDLKVKANQSSSLRTTHLATHMLQRLHDKVKNVNQSVKSIRKTTREELYQFFTSMQHTISTKVTIFLQEQTLKQLNNEVENKISLKLQRSFSESPELRRSRDRAATPELRRSKDKVDFEMRRSKDRMDFAGIRQEIEKQKASLADDKFNFLLRSSGLEETEEKLKHVQSQVAKLTEQLSSPEERRKLESFQEQMRNSLLDAKQMQSQLSNLSPYASRSPLTASRLNIEDVFDDDNLDAISGIKATPMVTKLDTNRSISSSISASSDSQMLSNRSYNDMVLNDALFDDHSSVSSLE